MNLYLHVLRFSVVRRHSGYILILSELTIIRNHPKLPRFIIVFYSSRDFCRDTSSEPKKRISATFCRDASDGFRFLDFGFYCTFLTFMVVEKSFASH